MYFRNYGLQKTWLGQCLKSLVSEDPSKRRMVNRSKQYWNLNNSTFTIFIVNFEDN